MSIETLLKWTEQKSFNTGFDMFLNDDICYSWYWLLMLASSEYFISTWHKGSDARDPHCLVRWCTQRCHGGNGHDDYFELFMIVMLLLLMDFMSVMMSLMMIQWAWCWFTFLWPGRWEEPKDLTWGDHRQACLQLCPTWQSQAWPYRISDEYWIL